MCTHTHTLSTVPFAQTLVHPFFFSHLTTFNSVFPVIMKHKHTYVYRQCIHCDNELSDFGYCTCTYLKDALAVFILQKYINSFHENKRQHLNVTDAACIYFYIS